VWRDGGAQQPLDRGMERWARESRVELPFDSILQFRFDREVTGRSIVRR
jgi:hypothetical protein